MIVNKLNKQDIKDEIILKSDLAGEFPIYLYISDAKDYIIYSTSIEKILNHEDVIKPLKVSEEGISFLLQSGVVPLPKTMYENIFIISIGTTATIKVNQNQIKIDFDFNFPFLNKDRGSEKPDKDKILDLLAEATISRIDKSKKTYLFHSAGKDSNMIALALHKAKYKEDITLVTYKSQDETKDESAISKSIADKLNFKHKILNLPKQLNEDDYKNIENYFSNIPFLTVDNATLAYPLYSSQIDFHDTNIIDGMGNDVYIGHIPGKTEFLMQKYLSKFSFLSKFNILKSEHKINSLLKLRHENTGLNGFNQFDSIKIFNQSINTKKNWKSESNLKNYLDLRAHIRGIHIDQEIFIRKVRNFSDLNRSHLILPWMNEEVVKYLFTIDKGYLFDEKELKNKLILRDILKEDLDLDSDKLGKKGYAFDYWKILILMGDKVRDEILSCKLWDNKEIKILIDRLYLNLQKKPKRASKIKSLIHRLYLISAWYNHNKYIKKND